MLPCWVLNPYTEEVSNIKLTNVVQSYSMNTADVWNKLGLTFTKSLAESRQSTYVNKIARPDILILVLESDIAASISRAKAGVLMDRN